MTQETARKTVNAILDLYARYGSAEYIGEPVSQLEHMSQAAELAMREGYEDAVVVAAFFHDIGHICVSRNQENDMEGWGTLSHEQIGADFLRSRGFPERVARLVEGHVQAKRYLTAVYPAYFNKLSDASKRTLQIQGGPMTLEETEIFECDSMFEVCLRLRTWDDEAKEEGVPVIDFDTIREKAISVLMDNHLTPSDLSTFQRG